MGFIFSTKSWIALKKNAPTEMNSIGAIILKLINDVFILKDVGLKFYILH